MPSYIIGIPKSDTCFRVQYDPDNHTIEDVENLYMGDEGTIIDPDGLYVAAPVGKLEVKIMPLGDYLLQKAGEKYEKQGGEDD